MHLFHCVFAHEPQSYQPSPMPFMEKQADPLHILWGLDFNHCHRVINLEQSHEDITALKCISLHISRKCGYWFPSLVLECAEWRCDVYSAIWFKHLTSFVCFSRYPIYLKGVQIHYEICCWLETRCAWKQAWLLNASLRDLVLNYGQL